MAWSSLRSLRKKVWHESTNNALESRISSADVAALRKQLTVLTEAGIILDHKKIKPHKETIIKPVRFCLDYQHFNQRTLPKLYNDRHIERGLNCLIGYHVYSVVSVLSGCSQLPHYPGERDLPYTVRPYGFYECERMQPGYCQNLADYQKLMESILSDLNMVELLVYLDYIIVFTNCLSEHISCLDKVFGRLESMGFTIYRDESLFCCPLVSYAGHFVFERGIAISDEKKGVLAKWPKPSTVSELQCYVDFCSYYRQFVSGFQDLAKPLNEILQEAADHKAKNPGGPWWATESIEERWTKKRDEAFYGLKEQLLQEKVLHRANMTQLEAPHVETKEQPD